MSVFSSRVRKEVTYDDLTVVIRKLSGASLEKAGEQRAIVAMRITAGAGADALRQARESARDQEKKPIAGAEPEPPKVVNPRDRHNGYDRETVLIAGIHGWNALDEKGGSLPVTPDNVLDLTEGACDFLFHEILDLSLPPIDAAKLEADQKKD